MTQDEPDTCRICSAPAEPGMPLFHPCKCSGTIRYIHQECLTTWLAHSRKKYCDVCKYQYTFTKVYSENMPKQIPFIMFLRKFAQKIFWAVVFGIRGVMVATIWLAFLPYVTVWTWRFYFIMGENIAWWIYDHPRPNSTPVFHNYFANLTLAEDQNRANSSDTSVLGLITSYPIWRALSADIFTGQIIASLIVLIFLGIFLLREWIIQNARPGVFEEEDAAEIDIPDGVEEEELGHEQEVGQLPEPPLPVGPPEIIPEVDENFEGRVSELERTLESEGAPPIRRAAVDASSVTLDEPGPSQRKRRVDALEDSDSADNDEHSLSRLHTRRKKVTDSPGAIASTEASFGSTDAPNGSAFDETDEAGPVDDHPRFNFAFTFEQAASSPHISSSTSLSFDRPSDRTDLFQYQPSSTLPFPITSGSTISSEAGPSKLREVSPLAAIPDASGSRDATDSLTDAWHITSSSSDNLQEHHEAPLMPTRQTFKAPKELDMDAISSVESVSDYDDEDEDEDEDSLSSGMRSISSSVPTVGSSSFRDDLDDYFPEVNANDVEGQGPIRVEELLDNDELLQDGPDEEVVEEDQEIVDVAEDQDAINDDDVDGALEEAIGMRGPLTSVFQNAALMIFVLDTTIGLAVWLPFTIGKTVALLLLEPARILHLLQWPIRVIRFATDPLVDLIALSLLHGVRVVMTRVLSGFPGVSVDSEIDVANLPKPLIRLGFLRMVVRTANRQGSSLLRGIDLASRTPLGRILEPYFAQLGKAVRLNATVMKSAWIELANGDANMNRCFAIAFGYLISGLLLAIYLNVLNVGSVQTAGRAVRNAIRQQLIVLKVAVFILIELVVFPLGCGTMLDFCTLQLFPDASVQSRMAFFTYAPVTVTFYHWMIGTMFMYQFAILLGGCRKIMRSGALWFIKDPQDQNFHPIRDILDRPTFTQIRKLLISAVMYSFVVALGMGGLVTSLQFVGSFLLPLRWKLREPISSVPLDLLFLHIVMPSTIKYFRPRRLVLALVTGYWKWAAKQLCLTSYMFGGFHRDEMRPSRSILAWFSSIFSQGKADCKRVKGAKDVVNGSFRRVPATDKISLPREVRATVAVDHCGDPLDDAGRRLIELQNSEAEKAKRDVAADYTVVYLPPHFRERVLFFIASLWVGGCSAFVAGLAIPVLFGRAVFSVALGREVHDIYSFVIGFYLLWGCYHIGVIFDRLDKRRQRHSNRHGQAQYAVYVFKRAMLWTGNVAWVAFWLGIVVPTLLALVIEVYIVHPLRIMFNPDLTLKIRIFESWAIGLIYTKMALSTMRLRPETRIDTAIKEMRERGWRDLNAVAVTLDIIAPVVAGLLGMLLLPIILVLGLQQILPTKLRESSLQWLTCPSIAILYVYPGIFIVAAGARICSALKSVLGSWAQQIRDSEFLVEMRLRNLESPGPKPETDLDKTSSTLAQEDGLQAN